MASKQLPAPKTPPSTSEKPLRAPDFTDRHFDPAEYLNQSLPSLTVASPPLNRDKAASPGPPAPVFLAELSTQVQSLLAQVNVQNARLSNTLTQLTDEILRSGKRLTYEVEVLRGETIELAHALTETVRGDIEKFVLDQRERLGGSKQTETGTDVQAQAKQATVTATEETGNQKEDEEELEQGEPEGEHLAQPPTPAPANDPQFIAHLRTLNHVRSRLEDVVHIFGDAMEWPLPPSELSMASSIISISSPSTGAGGGPDGSSSRSLEEKGQDVARKMREEVAALLASDGGGAAAVEAAARRVEALRVLATVWKGSVEEKARNRFVDGLAKMVEDRRRVLGEGQNMLLIAGKGGEQQQQQAGTAAGTRQRGFSASVRGRPAVDHQHRDGAEGSGGGGTGGGAASGLLRNLQRLRDEIYLE